MSELSQFGEFRGQQVLITGGLGFLGSNLAVRLVELGARVTVLDAMLEDHGGNLFNIAPIQDRVTINYSDVRDENSLRYLIRGKVTWLDSRDIRISEHEALGAEPDQLEPVPAQ